VYFSELTPVVTTHSVSFVVASLAAGETATIVYKRLSMSLRPARRDRLLKIPL
jgi:hypothetical protein